MTEEVTKERKLIPVKIVNGSGTTTTVEFAVSGRKKRVIIPTRVIENGKVEQTLLDAGMSASLPWKEIALSSNSGLTAEQAMKFETQLQGSGVWTFEDLISNPNQAIAAIRAVYNIDLTAMIIATRAYQKEA